MGSKLMCVMAMVHELKCDRKNVRTKFKVSSVPLQYQAQSHATCGSQSKLIHHQALLLPYRSSIFFFVSSFHSRSNSLTIVSSGIAYSLFIALIRSISKHKHNSLSCSLSVALGSLGSRQAQYGGGWCTGDTPIQWRKGPWANG